MMPHLFFYQLAVLGLLWLCVMLHAAWPSRCTTAQGTPAQPILPRRQRSKEPKPFAGLTLKPSCALCEQEATHPKLPPPVPPEPMPPTHRRPRTVDTSRHFCPYAGCHYRGWLGLGNLRANGHPSGGPWRQFHCTGCDGYFLETHGTLFHGTRVSVDLIVHVIGCLAEGLGIRGTARVFEVDPNTVLHWLVEAADQLRAFSHYFLHDLHCTQVQMDELYALLSAVKAGEVSEADAIERLERSPQWVWVAMDPESKLLLAIDVGNRTLAMAQRVVHQVVQVLAPDCAPLFLTDGFKEYMTALLTHYGQWVQFPRRQATGPAPKPRWMPLPGLLYAQVVKTMHRRRLVAVTVPPAVCTDTELLQAYQEQPITVEPGCRWIKHPAAISPVWREKPARMAALARRTVVGVLVEAVIQRQVRLYLRAHDQQVPGNKEPTATPTAAVVFALFTPVMLVQFAVDHRPYLQTQGVQDYHRIICAAVGIDQAWYQGAATGQNSSPWTIPP